MGLNAPAKLDYDKGGNQQEVIYSHGTAIKDVVASVQRMFSGMTNVPPDALHQFQLSMGQIEQKIDQSILFSEKSRKKVINHLQLPLLTTLPDFSDPPNRRADPLSQREYRITPFSGSENDKQFRCRDFLDKVMSIAVQYKLTEEATIHLLRSNCQNEVSIRVGELIREKCNLEEIVRKIELSYAGLENPHTAERKCNMYVRAPTESAEQAGKKIRQWAFMATRLKDDPQKAFQALAKESFLSSLDPDLTKELETTECTRELAGYPGFDYDMTVAEAARIEEERQARKNNYKSRNGSVDKVVNQVAQTPEDMNELVRLLVENSMSSAESDTGTNPEPNAEYMSIGDILQVGDQRVRGRNPQQGYTPQKGYTPQQGYTPRLPPWRRGQPLPIQTSKPPEAMAKGVKPNPYEKYLQILYEMEETEGNENTCMYTAENMDDFEDEGILVQGNVLLIPDGQGGFRRASPLELNCGRDQCMRCGRQGHYAFGRTAELCPIRMQPIVNVPCVKCKTGGHMAEICPNVPNTQNRSLPAPKN